MISDAHKLLEKLELALNGPLPGWEAHAKMINYDRPSVKEAMRLDPDATLSAVMVLLYPKDDLLHTLLMLRPDYDGVHGAQVSFPGGKKELEDKNLLTTALRETREETGIDTMEFRILGQLSEIYIPPSRYIVTPFVAYTETIGEFDPDPIEVEELIETPINHLLDSSNIKQKDITVRRSNTRINANYFDVDGHVVWGATAMMLSELRELLLRL